MVNKLNFLKELFKNVYFPVFIFTFIIGIILIYFISILSGDVKDENKEVVIHFAENISAPHQKIIDSFNERYKGKIRVVPINLPFSKFSTNERKELLARTLRSKSPHLDLFTVDQIWVPRFAKWAEPLDQYFLISAKDEFVQEALSTCYFNNNLYAVPFYLDIGLLYYKKDILEKEFGKELLKELKKGISWEKFIRISKILKKRNFIPYVFPAEGYEGLMCTFAEIEYGLVNKDLSTTGYDLSSEKFLEGIKFIKDLIYKHKISPEEIVNFKETESYKYFAEKNVVFLRGWPGLKQEAVMVDLLKGKNFELDYALLPSINNNMRGVFGGWNLMISKYSQHKKEVIIFIKYLVNQLSQSTLLKEGGHLPVKRVFYKNNDNQLQYFEYLFESGIHRPRLVNYTKISDIISFYLNLTLRDEISAEKAREMMLNSISKNGIESK